jgi:catechol 2,3-dioxygenase-like lactoylglutathione lyase family enzyme
MIIHANVGGKLRNINWNRENEINMTNRIAYITIVVKDYDEAIDFYINKLGFRLLEDTHLNESKRWVLISPDDSGFFCLLLAKASNKMQKSRIGNQTGGRVFLFLHTDNFDLYFKKLIEKQIKIIREPSIEDYGKVAVFEDLYGNLWDLVEPINRE